MQSFILTYGQMVMDFGGMPALAVVMVSPVLAFCGVFHLFTRNLR